MGADRLRMLSPLDRRPVKSKSGCVFSCVRRLMPSGTQLTIERARIPPKRGNVSDMLSRAVSDFETCDDDSEAESRGRDRLGSDWLESPESVLFHEVSEI